MNDTNSNLTVESHTRKAFIFLIMIFGMQGRNLSTVGLAKLKMGIEEQSPILLRDQ